MELKKIDHHNINTCSIEPMSTVNSDNFERIPIPELITYLYECINLIGSGNLRR